MKHSSTSSNASAQLQWREGVLHVALGGHQWGVPREVLPSLINLLKAGRSIDSPALDGVLPVSALPESPVSLASAPMRPLAGIAPSKRRKSRKRVGDALILWMEDNPGWRHEDYLLEMVIKHEMTDASPLRALKIALGKQRNVIFSDGGAGHWKLVTDKSAGAAPASERPPTLRERILAAAEPAPVALKSSVVRVKQGESRRKESPPEVAPEIEDDTEVRWTGVSQDEVARARRNLLGLGSNG